MQNAILRKKQRVEDIRVRIGGKFTIVSQGVETIIIGRVRKLRGRFFQGKIIFFFQNEDSNRILIAFRSIRSVGKTSPNSAKYHSVEVYIEQRLKRKLTHFQLSHSLLIS
ncbi:hypothetical protein SDC9_201447 [bioreactor metagenome]|uniref:Uncharacterized protein n=1 Tax=bioreactor metagenome TaxID=1076179 RepID=A0A645IR00_9ZZZZ